MSDIKARTMEQAFYLHRKAFFEKNNEHITEIHQLKAEVERLTNCKAEADRLKAEVERLRASSFVTAVPVEQYERVVKAGDAMADAFDLKYPVAGGLINAWNAAKEGKPSA